MDFKAIQELMKNMSDSQLSFIEIESDGIRITMKKGADREIISNNVAFTEKASVEKKDRINEVSSSSTNVAVVETEADSKNESTTNNYTVVSPIVGTFYSSPTPGSPSFVSIGTKVKKGDTLCVVEAMKLMNDIVSEVDGEIVEVLVNNEDIVEYGQGLFKIKLL